MDTKKNSGAKAPDTKRRRPRVPYVDTGGPSLTKQAFKDECDINKIVERHSAQGTLDEYLGITMQQRQGQFLDLSESVDFQTAHQIVQQAQEAFQTLPALVRERFRNDPGQLLAFMQDPKNADEAVALGLATKVAQAQQPPVNTPLPASKGSKKDSSGTPEE